MADSVEMQDIRGLDIDKAVKGFALVDYNFKQECTVSSTSADHIRWYTETAADLTATAPSKNANISPLSIFPTLEPDWTRETSYVRKYGNEGTISMEDIKSADIDVIARTLLRLTRAVVKQVDTRIYTIITSAATRQTFDVKTTGGKTQWDTTSGAFVKDLLHAKKLLYDYSYNPEGASLLLHPLDYRNVVNQLISTHGSSWPGFSSEKIRTGTVMSVLGVNVKVSSNCTVSNAVLVVPQAAVTWKTHTPITSVAIQEPGMHTTLRVWELGEGYATDPKAIVHITGTAQSAT